MFQLNEQLINQQINMKGHQKVLQLNSNLSKLIDSLCFQLAVNKPDQNSLSLIQILEWRNNNQISHQQLKELYSGWLQSKNIYDLFTAKQLKAYPKDKLIQYEGPIKKILNINQITKLLQTLNHLYNEIYLQKKVKSSPSPNAKNQIKNIEQVQKLFSFLDSQGIINLRLSQLFFLSAAIMIYENKQIPIDFEQFKAPFKTILSQMSCINGCVSLRAFKNYFLVFKERPLFIKNLNLILMEIKSLLNLTSQIKTKKSEFFPDLFQQSIQKWKSYPIFKNQQKKVQFLKRLFQQNQQILLFNQYTEADGIQTVLRQKYGSDLLTCLQIDSKLLTQYTQILQDTVNKYINLFQKVSFLLNKNSPNKTQYINQTSYLANNSFHNSIKKKQNVYQSQIYSAKKISKTAIKQRTPQKKRKNNEFNTSNNYRNKTPTNKNNRQNFQPYRQFGSTQKKSGTVRQSTPTKSTLSFLTDIPRTYRAAQKRGLNQNNFYDKLFFFRNKRVQSYEIVMKRLKNK